MKLLNLRKNKRGFTLVELLIVVVILGILAALILPRMLAQPERMVTGEALNYLGVIRRAQDATAQPSGSYASANSGSPGGAPTAPNGGWTGLGFSTLPTNTSFTYVCTGGAPVSGGVLCANVANPPPAGVCIAQRTSGPKANGRIGMSIDTGYICGCDGTIYTLSGTGNTTGASCL